MDRRHNSQTRLLQVKNTRRQRLVVVNHIKVIRIFQ